MTKNKVINPQISATDNKIFKFSKVISYAAILPEQVDVWSS